MSPYTNVLPHPHRHPHTGRQAASLGKTVAWHLHSVWRALERQGQRRAAPELARLASRLADTEPEVSAHLRAQSRGWSGR
jgi:hypothetical protein